MESAFGVEHGDFAKSFVGGKFVRAVDLTPKQARKVSRGGQWKKAKGVTDKDRQFKQEMASSANREFKRTADGIKLMPGKGMAGGGGTIREGSKSSGRSYVSGQATKKAKSLVERHEAVHANTKRSSYRLHGQIGRDPKKLFREEARADWMAGSGYKDRSNPSAYAIGARALRGKQKKPFRLDPGSQKATGKKRVKSFTNKKAVRAAAMSIDAKAPHYKMSNRKNAKKAFGAYAKLQDDFARRGVPQRIRGSRRD